MRIEQSKRVRKFLSTCDARLRIRLLEGVKGLTSNPMSGDIKPLQGDYYGFYRLRVGSYRIMFHIEGDTLYLEDIGSRGDFYK